VVTVDSFIASSDFVEYRLLGIRWIPKEPKETTNESRRSLTIRRFPAFLRRPSVVKHTNSFAIVNLRYWLIAALIHGLAAVAWVQSPAFAAEAAPAAPAAEAPKPAAEAPAPAAEAAKPAAEAPAKKSATKSSKKSSKKSTAPAAEPAAKPAQ
jgi:hypothetical protein